MVTLPGNPKPIINCHTHIFTGDHVPPYIAKTFVPWPFYYILSLRLVVRGFRTWYRFTEKRYRYPQYKKVLAAVYRIKIFMVRNRLIGFMRWLLGMAVTIHVFFILYDWLSLLSPPAPGAEAGYVASARAWLVAQNLLLPISSAGSKVALVLVLIIFFAAGRNMILFILKRLWKFFGILPGEQTRKLFMRYLNIGRFSFYTNQHDIFERLKAQYPPGSGFVVLPMDMHYMDAGAPAISYYQQMDALAALKTSPSHGPYVFPFVFADPRRMAAEPGYLTYTAHQGTVTLGDCFIRTFIEQKKFSGFKIYPALGYYPFDELLLPLWKYAADHQLPLLTHCIRGTIFYRGAKKKQWDHHPVFRQHVGAYAYEPMLLTEMENQHFINNFTHPLNYLCLLDETLLRIVVGQSSGKIQDLFGYAGPDTRLSHDLSHLKICFGHFGGDDEWQKFFELDRSNFVTQLVTRELDGIELARNEHGALSWPKLEQVWHTVDWYSIICSLMLQYSNVYSDISYIVHNPAILPLLKKTMQNAELKHRVLFGTDFYVVRNHKSEKNMLADMLAALSPDEFDWIARVNPREFLENNLHGSVVL